MQDQALIQQYFKQGVIKLERLFSNEEIGEIGEQLERYIEEQLAQLPPADFVLEADGNTVRNLWRMQEHSEYFARLGEDPRITELVGPLVQGEPVLMAVESFNKPARVGSAVPQHQDNAYFCLTPPDVLTVWIAIDQVTEENGPVYYVTGSHLQGTLPHMNSGVAGNSRGLSEPVEPLDPFVGLLQPGDALVHHGNIIHYSGPNVSERSRRGLLMVFKGAHCETDLELKQQYALANA